MKDWKTTALGVGAILAVLGHVVTSVAGGNGISAADISGLLAGVMGIFAKDSA